MLYEPPIATPVIYDNEVVDEDGNIGYDEDYIGDDEDILDDDFDDFHEPPLGYPAVCG